MLPEKTLGWGLSRSCIRTLSEYGAARKAEIGAENVFDFSLGNPSVPAPECVNRAIIDIIREQGDTVHAYTTAAGVPTLRKRIADDYNARFNSDLFSEGIYVTCGAASGLAASLRAVLMPGEEVMVMAPFFPEYRVFIEASGGELVIVPPTEDMQVDTAAFKNLLSAKTKAVIINSPNNPSGVVLSEGCINVICSILKEHEQVTGSTVYIISDEPYRELVFGYTTVPSIINLYDDTIMCYSFSKSMSLPGERIGYVAVTRRMKDWENVYAGIMGAARALGYVNPPSLLQRVIERCLGQYSDIAQYEANRDLICGELSKMGYKFPIPKGAFYLLVKSPSGDGNELSERAKKHELLLVPSDDFGVKGYVRISYCVSRDSIERSLPAFRDLMSEYLG